MRRPDGTGRVPDPRLHAAQRVEAAAGVRAQARDRCDHAQGTAKELQANVTLQAADDQLAARRRWQRWVEESDY